MCYSVIKEAGCSTICPYNMTILPYLHTKHFIIRRSIWPDIATTLRKYKWFKACKYFICLIYFNSPSTKLIQIFSLCGVIRSWTHRMFFCQGWQSLNTLQRRMQVSRELNQEDVPNVHIHFQWFIPNFSMRAFREILYFSPWKHHLKGALSDRQHFTACSSISPFFHFGV